MLCWFTPIFKLQSVLLNFIVLFYLYVVLAFGYVSEILKVIIFYSLEECVFLFILFSLVKDLLRNVPYFLQVIIDDWSLLNFAIR